MKLFTKAEVIKNQDKLVKLGLIIEALKKTLERREKTIENLKGRVRNTNKKLDKTEKHLENVLHQLKIVQNREREELEMYKAEKAVCHKLQKENEDLKHTIEALQHGLQLPGGDSNE